MAKKSIAIVLSAGKGRRMHSRTAKQYLHIKGKPVIYYALKTFQDCPFIDEIILITGEEDKEFCRHDIIEKYGLDKVGQIVSGGKERFHSVYNGLTAAQECDFVYIHDGARPFVTQNMLERLQKAAEEYHACVAGMPVKDTIKISDDNGFCASTPKRSLVWQIQTPQVFSYSLVKDAYQKLMDALAAGKDLSVTDDAMVVECMTDHKVKLIEGAYSNLKITTPEDLKTAEIFLENF
ncbi:MAG: 2-C-methyl-D-erythritol 4-phosphate cytidylyltransferase [Eubacteriales bacterium]|nr:2-C-methyl-D-erythritol 4-phosphate cytidylyltransferase [Eubacteriales bacterium]